MIRNTTVVIIAAVMCCISTTVWGEIYFENESDPCGCFVDDLDIYDGDYYWYVDADETSVVDIFGGTVDEFAPFGFSTANISGGQTKVLDALQTSRVNITGGEVLDLSASGQSMVSIIGGEVDWLYVSDGSEATVVNGQVGYLWAEGLSTVDITGYDISYEPYFSYDNTREAWEGLLTGYWQGSESTPFSIITWDEGTYDQIVLHDLGPLPGLPEPATLLLLGCGMLVLRKRG
ncbi:MAG TPA: hypothetical protein HPP87_05620 [Planctomycetes bacterium]|nr:hypothetical protein [Planctomycetota bacterium]